MELLEVQIYSVLENEFCIEETVFLSMVDIQSIFSHFFLIKFFVFRKIELDFFSLLPTY